MVSIESVGVDLSSPDGSARSASTDESAQSTPVWSGDPNSYERPKIKGLLFRAFATSGELADEKFGYAASLDKKKWIDAYFEDGVELFPDFNRPALAMRNYDVIQYEDIRRRFPADEDVRVFIRMTHEICVHNFLALVIFKRIIGLLAISSLLFAATSGRPMLESFIRANLVGSDLTMGDPTAVQLRLIAAGAMTILILFFIANSWLFSQFVRATQSTCSLLTQNIQGKLSKMESAYTTALKNIRDQYAPVNRDDPWPDRAYWTAILILWYPKRVENIEKAFQIDMWRTRLAFAGIYALGLVLSVAVFGLSALLFMSAGVEGLTSLLLYGFSGLIVFLSYFLYRPPLQLVRTYVDVRYWTTFQALKMHESVAAIIKADKLQILDELNRQRGGRPGG